MLIDLVRLARICTIKLLISKNCDQIGYFELDCQIEWIIEIKLTAGTIPLLPWITLNRCILDLGHHDTIR